MRDRLIVLALIVISGNPVLAQFPREVVYLVPAALLAFYASIRHPPVTRRDLLLIAVFSALSSIHFVSFGADVLSASFGFLVRVTLALLALRVIPNFHRHYTTCMTALALLSFVFFVPVRAGVDLPHLLAPLRFSMEGIAMDHIGVHNFHSPDEWRRNCGMFGEPGMFAGYLNLALLLAIAEPGRASRLKLIVLVLGVLTTQSTTGYLALVFVLAIQNMFRRVTRMGGLGYLMAVPAVVIVCAVGWVAYETLPFMKAKIEHQTTSAFDSAEGASITRFGNLLFDLDYIQKRPIAGWSPRHATRMSVDPDALKLAWGQGNGLSGFAVKFGLVGLIAYCWAVYAMFRQKYGSAALGAAAVCVIAVLLTGEQFLDAPLFLTLMFLPNPLPESEPLPDAVAVA
jgi:hypothetical protein